MRLYLAKMIKCLVLTFLLLLPVSVLIAEPSVVEALKASEHWLLPADECPADVMGQPKEVAYNEDYCLKHIDKCLKQCKKNSAYACYNLAQALQTLNDTAFSKYYSGAYLRSCRLGSISGCTNSAAGMQLEQGKDKTPCALRTYEAACKHEDPWACTMYGYHLGYGIGIKEDRKQALKALFKACALTMGDACNRASAIIQDLENES